MRVLACLPCRCVLERIEIRGGTVVICLACDEIGEEHHVVHGARLSPYSDAPRRRKRAA